MRRIVVTNDAVVEGCRLEVTCREDETSVKADTPLIDGDAYGTGKFQKVTMSERSAKAWANYYLMVAATIKEANELRGQAYKLGEDKPQVTSYEPRLGEPEIGRLSSSESNLPDNDDDVPF